MKKKLPSGIMQFISCVKWSYLEGCRNLMCRSRQMQHLKCLILVTNTRIFARSTLLSRLLLKSLLYSPLSSNMIDGLMMLYFTYLFTHIHMDIFALYKVYVHTQYILNINKIVSILSICMQKKLRHLSEIGSAYIVKCICNGKACILYA